MLLEAKTKIFEQNYLKNIAMLHCTELFPNPCITSVTNKHSDIEALAISLTILSLWILSKLDEIRYVGRLVHSRAEVNFEEPPIRR